MNIKIISFDECKIKRMRDRGMGGVRGLVTTNEGITYVAKPECLNQTLNEVMAQIMLKSLGLYSIEYAFVKILDTYYGALKFIAGLKRIGMKNYRSLNKKQKTEYLKHLFLNYFLDNEDIMGEIYLTEEGKIVYLDYGDAGVRISLKGIDKLEPELRDFFVSAALKREDSIHIRSLVKSFARYAYEHFVDEDVSSDDVRKIIESMLMGIVDFDCREYEKFLEDLMHLHSELHAYIYQEHLNGLVDDAVEISKNLDDIWKDMLTE